MSMLLTGCGNSRTAVNEIQRITFSVTPTSGDWSVTFGGQTALNLAASIDAAGLESQLAAMSSIGAGSVSVTGSGASGFTVTFKGALAGQAQPLLTVDDSGLLQSASTITVARVQAGVTEVAGRQESQRITVNADGGGWTVSAGGSSGQAQWNDTAANVQTAVNTAVSPATVTVTGDGGPWTVAWDSPGPRSLLVVASNPSPGAGLTQGGGDGSVLCEPISGGVDTIAGVPEIQTETLADGPTGGTWQSSQAMGSGQIDYNASAGAVTGSLTGITATGSDGGPYTLTWTANGPQSLLNPDGTSLTRGGVSATVSEIQHGG